MQIFLPEFESKIITLVAAFRFIVFAIMVVGLIAAVASQRVQSAGLLSVLAKAMIIVAAVAYEDIWFPKVEQVFLVASNYINPGYSDHPTLSADTIRESTTKNPEGQAWSWRRLSESMYHSFVSAIAHTFIYIGTLITVPMLILQYILRWLLYLLTPFALAVLLLPGFATMGTRFFQQVLAILAWPVGFAITDLVALAIWHSFMGALNPVPTGAADLVYAPLVSLIGGILATIMIIVGMVSTPVVMQMLFAHGHAFTGATVNPVSIVRSSAHFLSAQSRSGSSASRAFLNGPAAASAPAPLAARPTI